MTATLPAWALTKEIWTGLGTNFWNKILYHNSVKKLDDKVGEYLQKVDLAKDIAKFPKGQDTVIDVEELNVSGGQRQKIVLARAELNQSDFILIDEATAAVDQDSTKRILKNLLKTNATIIFIGHNFTNEMVDMFDRQIVLSK
ncbi:ATP-binding cassette domain-containing protein [Lactobacillus delbrueckii subsp. bulgaricus]